MSCLKGDTHTEREREKDLFCRPQKVEEEKKIEMWMQQWSARKKMFRVASVLPGGIRALSSLSLSRYFVFSFHFCHPLVWLLYVVGMANEIRPQCSNGDYLQQHQKGAAGLRMQQTLWKVNHFTQTNTYFMVLKLCADCSNGRFNILKTYSD